MVDLAKIANTAKTPQQILAALDSVSKELRRLGARRVGLFGSYSTGNATPDSDLDFVVELERNSFDMYMEVNCATRSSRTRFMPRDYKLYLEDILQAIDKIENYLGDSSFESFTANPMQVDAVLHNL
jgi:predicted nucleotidyltransferase